MAQAHVQVRLGNMQHATCSMQHAAQCMQHAAEDRSSGVVHAVHVAVVCCTLQLSASPGGTTRQSSGGYELRIAELYGSFHLRRPHEPSLRCPLPCRLRQPCQVGFLPPAAVQVRGAQRPLRPSGCSPPWLATLAAWPRSSEGSMYAKRRRLRRLGAPRAAQYTGGAGSTGTSVRSASSSSSGERRRC
jgi:hypothetical protein